MASGSATASLAQPESWLDERVLPGYAAAASLVLLSAHAVWNSPLVKALRASHKDQKQPEETVVSPGGFITSRGGITIFVYKLTTLGCVLSLLTLNLVTVTTGDATWVETVFASALVYATILAVWNVLASSRKALFVSAHLSFVTFATLAVYLYRDVWPLMTFTLEPKDSAEGDIMWYKIFLAALAGVVLPIFEPYPYIPYDSAHPMEVANPEQTACIASFLTYVFLDPMIWTAYRMPHLPFEKLPPLCDYDEVRHLIKRGYPNLTGKTRASIFMGLIRTFKRSLTFQVLAMILISCGRTATPIGTNRLLAYLETGGEGAIVKPWVWILWLSGGPLLETICFQLFIFLSTGSLARMNSIFTSLIFDHSLRIRLKSDVSEAKDETTADTSSAATLTGDGSEHGGDNLIVDGADETATEKTKEVGKGGNFTGKLNNLVTSDLENMVFGRDFLFIVLLAPLMSAMSMWFLYGVLGWSSFVGLAVMIILFPVPTWITAQTNQVQKDKMDFTDARIQSVSEALGMLRMIKLFGWEERVSGMLYDKRDAELRLVRKRKLLDLGLMVANNVIPVLHMLATYAVYTTVMKRELTASVVFSSVAAFRTIRSQLVDITWFTQGVIGANVSLGRFADFLRTTELLDEFTESAHEDVLDDTIHAHIDDIGFGQADFSWSNEDGGSRDGAVTPSRRAFRLRIDDEVHFKKGTFSLVVGPTGSGKTSVLMALLGEMHYMPRGPDSWFNLPRGGGVAYAAQESWVQNDTIKDNILFGAPYDEIRYKKVVYQCGLTRDLSLFDAGDETEVGEKGLTLSGGQKARVTLARAVYSSAEILLLDDVLAALDVHTSRWIVDKCFKGDLIRGRTVILVTHNIAMASPLADFVVSLRDGRVVSQGTINDALSKNTELAVEFEHEMDAVNSEAEKVDAVDEEADTKPVDTKSSGSKLVVAEEIAIGRVGWGSYKLIFDGLGGKRPFTFWIQYLGVVTLAKIAQVFATWWLGYWAQQYGLREPGAIKAFFYLGIYSAIAASDALTTAYYGVVYTFGTLRASRVIHNALITSLLRSTFRWLDVTPTSRAIARCTQDIQTIDDTLTTDMDWLIGITIDILIRLAIVVWTTPVFCLPAILVAILGGVIGKVYIKAQLSIKREMSNAKAPVLAVFGSAVAGLISIRAYSAQNTFRNMLYNRIDHYMRTARPYYNSNRWIGQRLDTLGQLFTASLAFYLVYGGVGATASTIGFVLSMSSSFSEMLLYWVRIYNDLEVAGNSLERIQQYIEIDHEPELKASGQPPAYWPASGELHVENLSARYSVDGPLVLRDVSFHVRAGERVGVVGRTGSGKSTLTLALLRCIYTEGTVIYDGLQTNALNLDSLRSSITIIPQVPELMSGSLRHNLDMFGKHDDAVLNDALRAAGLFSLQNASDENRLTLDSEIASAGGNLSVGQRQIIALARAMVRQSKLLILDEATSAIDYETDAVIQSSLRSELKSDVTVITVAHRLQTIMDYDKILVLDAGKVVEFDSPKALLKHKDGLLRALVEESSDKEALLAMAEGQVLNGH